MKKIFVNMFFFLCIFALAGCGKKEASTVTIDNNNSIVADTDKALFFAEFEANEDSSEASVSTTKEQDEIELKRIDDNKRMDTYIEEVTADTLRLVTESAEDGYIRPEFMEQIENKFFVLARIEEQDIVLYGLYGCERMVLRVQDKVIPLYMPCTGVQMILPTISCGDYDNDGMLEYAIKTHYKTGTGVSGDDLDIVELHDEEYSIHSFDEADRLKFLGQIQYDYDKSVRVVTVHNGDKNIGLNIGTVLDDCADDNGKSADFDKLCFGDIESFFLMDGNWYYAADGGITTSTRVWPQYECCMRMICPVYYNEESGFSFGEMQFEPYYYLDKMQFYQNTEFEKVINVWHADINHDGEMEDVVASMSCADKESKNLDVNTLFLQGEVCYVRVYPSEEGICDLEKNEDTDGYCMMEAIWESAAYAEAHAGNGMLYLVNKDGNDYIMSAFSTFSQGIYSAQYQVLQYSHYGAMPYIVDEASITVDLNSDQIEVIDDAMKIDEMVSFTQKWDEWTRDGIILVKTDVEDGSIINTSGDHKYEAWEIWKSLEHFVDMECSHLEEVPSGTALKDMNSLKQTLTSVKKKRLYWAEYLHGSKTVVHDDKHHADKHH